MTLFRVTCNHTDLVHLATPEKLALCGGHWRSANTEWTRGAEVEDVDRLLLTEDVCQACQQQLDSLQ